VGASGSAPQWVKLVRSGSSITGYTSTTGGTWTLVATTTLSTAATVYVGLAVTSHANGILCSAGFDNVAVSSSGGNAPPTVTMTTPAEGATAVAPATIALGATAIDSNGIDHVEFYQGSTLIGSSTNGRGDGSQAYTATWSNVGAGTYTLTAKAFDTLGATTTSGPVHITVSNAAGGVPPPWATQDIGAVSPAGSATGDGVAFTVQGAGDDIWNGADAFRFVYEPLTGDGHIIARVTSVQNTNGWAKAGVMIREDLSASARQASVIVSPGNGVAFEWRAAPGSASSYVGASGSAPQWLKLVRTGTTISAYVSPDGSTWTPVGTTTLNTGSTVYIGLAVTSHANGVLCTATFDSVGF
jgi:regulation of enolase protein 1 (concanavalin A-like superfamily)